MNYLWFSIVMVFSLFSLVNVNSQEEPVFDVTKLADHIYKLSTDGGGYTVKVIASVGEDGILLVDAGQKSTGESLKEQIKSLWGGEPKYIISTHAHIEHTGGNIAFGKDPVIIGHRNIRPRLTTGSFLFDEFTEAALPEIEFVDSLTLYFNGEEIKLISFTGAHDNSDIIVWFTKSGVACVGAISNGFHFPSVDGTGDVLKYADVAQKVIDLLPEDTKIIPGHGADCSMDDFRAFQKMLAETMEIVRLGLAEGKELKTLQDEDVLKDWKSFEGSYTDANQWIDYLVAGFQKDDGDTDSLEKIFGPMYYAIKENGAEAAVQKYYDLKKNHSDKFSFTDAELIYIPHKLYSNGKIPEAARFFELYLKEYPEGKYAYYGHYVLGDIYDEKGDTQLALENYRKSLELNPDNTRVAEKIEELEKE